MKVKNIAGKLRVAFTAASIAAISATSVLPAMTVSAMGDTGQNANPSAANYITDGVINPSATGRITIHKFINNDGTMGVADGHKVDTITQDSKTSATFATPKVAKDKESVSGGAQDNGKVKSGGDKITVKGSENGKSNGNTGLEGEQGKTGHTDSARDNEIYDGDEYSQALPVSNVGFSYKKVADVVSVAGKINRADADGSDNDEQTRTERETGSDTYTGAGIYYANVDYELLELGEAYGVTPKATKLFDNEDEDQDAEYYTTNAMENFLAKIENSGTNTDKNSAYYGMTGSQALTEYTRYGSSNSTAETTGVSDTDEGFANGNFGLTKEDGSTSAEGLPLGLYLIGETDITHHDGLDENGNLIGRDEDTVASEYPILKNRAKPFFVSLPTTNVANVKETLSDGTVFTHKPGTVWEYDQDVYPKDQTVNISKAIVDPDEKAADKKLRTREDFQIGDTINQVIWADAPVPESSFTSTADADPDTENTETKENRYRKFVISDEMETSLAFDGVTRVAIIDKVANPTKNTDFTKNSGKDGFVELKEGVDYTVGKSVHKGDAIPESYKESDYKHRNLHTFSVSLTTSGLAKLNKITKDSQVVVWFDSTLNKDAMIGSTDAAQDTSTNAATVTTSNNNKPSLDYTDSFWPEQEVEGNKVYVFTHQLNLKKDGLKDGSEAGFVVTRKTDTDDSAENITNPGNITEGKRTGDGSYLTDFARSSVKNIEQYRTGNYYFKDETSKKSTGHVAFVKEADGVYHLYDNSIDDASGKTVNGSASSAFGGSAMHTTKLGDAANADLKDAQAVGAIVTVLHPDSKGNLKVKGLDSDTGYIFKEVMTENGHNLLKDPMKVTLKETDKTAKAGSKDYKDQDVWRDGRLVAYNSNAKNADGETTPEVYNVLDGSNVTIGNDGLWEVISGRLTNSNAAALTINSQNNGIAEMEVDNYKTITLHTGGTGRMVLYILGAAMAAGLVGYMVVEDEKKKKNLNTPTQQ